MYRGGKTLRLYLYHEVRTAVCAGGIGTDKVLVECGKYLLRVVSLDRCMFGRLHVSGRGTKRASVYEVRSRWHVKSEYDTR